MDGSIPPAEVPEGYMVNAVGYLCPTKSIRPDVLLEDQAVKLLCAQALAMQAALAAFRNQAFSDADAHLALISEKYRAKPRSASNAILISFDGLQKVEISTGHFVTFGPELQAARSLIDECLEVWSRGANDHLRALVNNAFAIGEGGKLRVDRVLALRQVKIEDPTWLRAMDAISDAIRPTYSKRYIRFHRRENVDAPWVQISLDLARVA